MPHAFRHVSFHIKVQTCQLFTSSFISISFRPVLQPVWLTVPTADTTQSVSGTLTAFHENSQTFKDTQQSHSSSFQLPNIQLFSKADILRESHGSLQALAYEERQ